jgi:hypothetical protein
MLGDGDRVDMRLYYWASSKDIHYYSSGLGQCETIIGSHFHTDVNSEFFIGVEGDPTAIYSLCWILKIITPCLCLNVTIT